MRRLSNLRGRAEGWKTLTVAAIVTGGWVGWGDRAGLLPARLGGPKLPEIKVYTSSTCGFCIAAKQLLSSVEAPFEEIQLDQNPELRLKLSEENNGWRTVPMIFIGESFVGGFQELLKLHQQGELVKMIG
jgi:glutaredoxin 3